MNRVKNGPGIALIILIVILLSLTLLQFPAAGSEHPDRPTIQVKDDDGIEFSIFYPPNKTSENGIPHWAWDKDGKVYDITGQYITMSDEEACEKYGICKKQYR